MEGGEQRVTLRVTLRASLSLLISLVPCTHPEHPVAAWGFGRWCWSSWDRPGELAISSLCLLSQGSDCHWCEVTEITVSNPSVPHPPLLMPWPFPNLLVPQPSSGRCWIQPQGTLLSQKSPTKVEWNTKYLIPLRKERDVFILFCLFLYELEVFSNPVCWLQ